MRASRLAHALVIPEKTWAGPRRDCSREDRPLLERAILDSNQWPLAPEKAQANFQGLHPLTPTSQPSDIVTITHRTKPTHSHPHSPVSTQFTTRLLPDFGRLLTVKEAAATLRVSTATVYKLVNSGALVSIRVRNSIRIPEQAIASRSE
jgi:excisionase family DNA binding protein